MNWWVRPKLPNWVKHGVVYFVSLSLLMQKQYR